MRKNYKGFWFCLICMLCITSVEARHIIGGEITYRCKGNNVYEITMRIYRDCFGNGANFDSSPGSIIGATLTVYRGTSTTPFLRREITTAPAVTNILPNLSNPCLVAPPNLCVEEGIYVFDVELPASTESYTISYQRCCRNNTIFNIRNPESVGATYTIDITPEAQAVCNSSPVFNNFPPIVICAGEPIDFDFSATDADGDLLTYEFCTPFLGGGTNENPFTVADGVAPDPDLPPPYSGVVYNVGFTGTNPMGGNPIVAINPVTGLITGTPNVLGQYVVGVCVTESRNGTVLSVLRRDFQFNVANCDPTVVADIQEDQIVQLIDSTIYVVKSCGETQVNFINESFQPQFIQTYNWSFDVGTGTPLTSSDRNATINFPGLGTYYGLLILNPGLNCNDTAYIRVDVLPDIRSDFSSAYDTCVAGPIDFTSLAVSDAGPNAIIRHAWFYGDGNTDNVQDPSHTFATPGNKTVTYEVEDINGCIDRIPKTIPYFPVPAIIVVSPDEANGCAPQEVVFTNLSTPINADYDIVWDFGDGTTGVGISPTHIYLNEGIFSVSVDITSPIGCMTDTVFNNLIRVRPSPIAGFTYNPQELSSFDPVITITDASVDAARWRYNFDRFGFSSIPNPTFTFPDTGMVEIVQIVTHISGCTDTARAMVDIVPKVTHFLPNAFTPDGDGYNDVFGGVGIFEGIRDYSLTIWNRYGERLYETNDPTIRWNGRENNEGKPLQDGVYVYLLEYREPRGKVIKEKGTLTLVR